MRSFCAKREKLRLLCMLKNWDVSCLKYALRTVNPLPTALTLEWGCSPIKSLALKFCLQFPPIYCHFNLTTVFHVHHQLVENSEWQTTVPMSHQCVYLSALGFIVHFGTIYLVIQTILIIIFRDDRASEEDMLMWVIYLLDFLAIKLYFRRGSSIAASWNPVTLPTNLQTLPHDSPTAFPLVNWVG